MKKLWFTTSSNARRFLCSKRVFNQGKNVRNEGKADINRADSSNNNGALRVLKIIKIDDLPNLEQKLQNVGKKV
jgi:hypothetical protein